MKRTITSIFILAVVAGFVALRMVHTAFFDAFVFLLMFISSFEMISALKKSGKMLFEQLIVVYPVVVAAAYIFCESVFTAIVVQILSIIVIFLCSMGIELVMYATRRYHGMPMVDAENLLKVTKNTMSVIVYPLTIISSMFVINHFVDGYNLGYVLIITMFAVSMLTDTFAYAFGMLFGKNRAKFAPEISPHKSVVGCIGGLVGGLIAGVLCWLAFYHYNVFGAAQMVTMPTYISIILFFFVGILGSIATQFGDLVASAIKRQCAVKDYGKLLPGHGGIMDRIDGEMWCSAIVAALFALLI